MNNRLKLLFIIIPLVINGCVTFSKMNSFEGKIFFERWDKECKEVELWAMDIDGKNQKLIIKQPQIENLPNDEKIWIGRLVPSPDEHKVGFNVVRKKDSPCASESNIYIMDINGTNQIKLTEKYIDVHVDWLCDGTKIVFASNRSGKGQELYKIDTDKTNIVKLTDNFMGDTTTSSFPRWSPDGKKIVFIAGTIIPWGDFTRYQNSEIYTIDANGKNLRKLTDNSVNDGDPTWSPDGKKIAFVHGYMLYTMDNDGKNLRQLTDEHQSAVFSPFWLPDGKKIIFTRLVDDKTTYRVNSDIFIIDIKTKKVTNLTNTPDIDETNPCWRPIAK